MFKAREMNTTEIVLEVSIIVTAVVSLLSNVLVLLCFVHSAEIRSHVPGIFVLNLSLSNILLSFINMPATLFGIIKKEKPFGDFFCQAVSFAETFLITNGMLSMAALSIDRWIAVVFPLRYSTKMGYRDAFLILVYSWLHSAAFSLSEILMSWGDYSHVYASCTLHYDGQRDRGQSRYVAFATFTAFLHSGGFALCLLIMCLAYMKVLRVARFHCKRIDFITVQTLFLLVDIHPSVKERCLAEQKTRRQRSTKKIFFFIGSFIICFTPYVITRLVQLLPRVQIHPYWGITTKCLTYAKAASDPFVYSLLRQQYQKVLVSITNRVLRRGMHPLLSNSTSSTCDTDDIVRVP